LAALIGAVLRTLYMYGAFTSVTPGFAGQCGAIAGVDNGDATSHEAYTGTTRSAFSGKALAILRSTKTSGSITLQASSDALTGASVRIATNAP